MIELKSIIYLASIYRQERPDLVHHFTIKSVLYGSLVAHLTGVPMIVNAITGVGSVFAGKKWYSRILLIIVKMWYRFVLRRSQVIFENRENLEMFIDLGLVDEKQANLVRSAGVDIGRYPPTDEPKGVPVVMLASRMLWDKGVGEFVEAARILKREDIQAIFVLVGDTYSGNPSAIPREQLSAWQDEGVLSWWGWRDDMPVVLKQANVVCLPSYHEGVPTVLLEAASTKRAVITTDAPGCRDAVVPGETGLLVPIKDPNALARAIQSLVDDEPLRVSMGLAGRKLVEREFSVRKVVEGTIAIYIKAGLLSIQM